MSSTDVYARYAQYLREMRFPPAILEEQMGNPIQFGKRSLSQIFDETLTEIQKAP